MPQVCQATNNRTLMSKVKDMASIHLGTRSLLSAEVVVHQKEQTLALLKKYLKNSRSSLTCKKPNKVRPKKSLLKVLSKVETFSRPSISLLRKVLLGAIKM